MEADRPLREPSVHVWKTSAMEIAVAGVGSPPAAVARPRRMWHALRPRGWAPASLVAAALLTPIIPGLAPAAGPPAALHGTVVDRRTRLPIGEVRLTLTNPSDTTDIRVT